MCETLQIYMYSIYSCFHRKESIVWNRFWKGLFSSKLITTHFWKLQKIFLYEEKIYDFNKQSRYFEVINLLLLRMIHKLWLTCFLPEICFYLILSESETTTSVSLNFRISLGNKFNICFYIPTRTSILMVTFTVMSHFAFEFLF